MSAVGTYEEIELLELCELGDCDLEALERCELIVIDGKNDNGTTFFSFTQKAREIADLHWIDLFN